MKQGDIIYENNLWQIIVDKIETMPRAVSSKWEGEKAAVLYTFILYSGEVKFKWYYDAVPHNSFPPVDLETIKQGAIKTLKSFIQ